MSPTIWSLDETVSLNRSLAVLASGGTSDQVIKELVLRVIRSNDINGNVLDYGSGKGELLAQLNRLKIFNTLYGVDYLERPPLLDHRIQWHVQDLNNPLEITLDSINVLIASEVIEHLENPRATFRDFYNILNKNGHLILTMPNQESIRSYGSLLIDGHFADFTSNSYPAHIVALLRLDLQRICNEVGFRPPKFYYSNYGRIPKFVGRSWQSISLGLLRGQLFSDTIAMYTSKI